MGQRASLLAMLRQLLEDMLAIQQAGAGYYSWKQPQVEARLQEMLAEAPTTPDGRLDLWMEFAGSPNAHHRLSQVARVSAEQPWLVTHTVEAEDGGPPRVFGIDVSDLDRDLLAAAHCDITGSAFARDSRSSRSARTSV